MNYRVTHTTTYVYNKFVSLCHNLAHLRPRDYLGQTCTGSELLINPTPAVLNEQIDYFGNHATFFTIQEPHQELTVTAVSKVRVSPPPSLDAAATPPWDKVRTLVQAEHNQESLDAYQFVFDSPYVERSVELASYAADSFTAGRPLLEAALDLTRRIHADFEYDPTATTITTPLRDVLTLGRGVCQDFAHLQIGCLRSLGLAARYVSGYLLTSPPPGQEHLVGADASHAWLGVYCPGFGWIDLDPTNNLMPSGKHVLLAWGRDYEDVSPIKGIVLGGGRHFVNVNVDVLPSDDPLPFPAD